MSEQLYRRSDKALFSGVGEDIVALHVDNGHCYGMEKVSATIWELLAEPIGVGALCDRLTAMYEVEPEVCRADVERLLQDFRNEGLIETVESR
jgi:transposase InsO family protein